MGRLRKTCLLMLLLLYTAGIQAQTIHMVATDWSPFYGPDLPEQGFVAEIARQAFKRQGYKFELTFMPWKRAMLLAKNGDAHGLFACWNNKTLAADYHFSREIMASGDAHFLAGHSSTLRGLRTEDLLRLHSQDPRPLRVGIGRDYTVSKELSLLFTTHQVERIDVNSVAQLFPLFEKKGRIDLILENYQVAKYHFQRAYPDAPFPLKVVGKDYVDNGLYICWSKQVEGVLELRDAFDQALRAMRRDGSMARIKTAFGIVPPNAAGPLYAPDR